MEDNPDYNVRLMFAELFALCVFDLSTPPPLYTFKIFKTPNGVTGTELTNAYVFLMFADTEPVPNRYRVGTEPVPRSQMHTFF